MNFADSLSAGNAPPPTGGPLGRIRAAFADVSALRVAALAVFLAGLLIAWVTLNPFPDMSRLNRGDLVTGKEGLTYAAFALLAVVSLFLCLRDHRRALASLATPSLILLAGWLCLSVVLSQDPATSAKRLTITAAVIALTACLPLLAGSRAALRNLLAVAALSLLALCYLGMLLVPDLSIHQARDYLEPGLAGNWRGVFGHKNAAAAVMAMVLIVGVGVFRAGARIAGAAIAALALVFLVGSEGKSAFALTFAVFAVIGLFAVVRSFAGRAILALGPIVVLNLLSIGTVVSDTLAAIVASLPIDATFTGRTDIWRFAVEALTARPIAGYGFSAFWATQSLRDAAQDSNSWAGQAAHSHNGFLDVTLTLGAVGIVLCLAALAIKPLRDYQSAAARGGKADPFATMFLQLWLFGLFLSSMESFFFDRSDPIWITFLFAVFGLHYLGRFRTR